MGRKIGRVGWTVALTLFLAGCATTKLTLVWMDEAYRDHRLDNVLVMGVSDRITMRRVFESKFVTQQIGRAHV